LPGFDRLHINARHRPAWPGDPVRRCFTVQTRTTQDYSIARSSRAMTAVC